MAENVLGYDLHVHSVHSHDSSIPVEDIVRVWDNNSILSVVCDHDTIAGSVEVSALLRRKDPDLPVIIAEEILTQEGDIIGIFLTEEIAPGMSAEETLDIISGQGGLSIIPHPFSTLRSSSIGRHVLDTIIDRVDIIEGYNGKMMRAGENQVASEYAWAHGKPVSLGSDAHTPPELGFCHMRIDPFESPSEFLSNLRTCTNYNRSNVLEPV